MRDYPTHTARGRDSDDDGLIPSRRIRRPLRRFVWLIVAALILEAVIVVEISRHRDEEIRELACSVVHYYAPGRAPVIDDLRARYRCPAYIPPSKGGTHR